MFYKNKKGFTLIELLIVVLLIGVLSGIALSVINPQGIRAKARDSQRISDLKTLQVALETYFSDNRSYPVSASFTPISTGLSGPLALLLDDPADPNDPVYINILPEDPSQGINVPTGASCGTGVDVHDYYYQSDGSNYEVMAVLEIISSGSDQNSYCEIMQNPL